MRAAHTAVIDTSLLLALAGARALERILFDAGCDWRVTPNVYGEVVSPTRDVLDQALAAGHLHLSAVDTTDPLQMREWTRWELVVDAGQAEVITLALTRGWVAGLEDRYAQRALDRDPGPGHWINAASVLLSAVRSGVLLESEADAMFATLDSYRGYCRRGVASLGKLGAIVGGMLHT
jgi:hypothetical protein